MADGAPADEGLGDRAHFDGSQHPRRDAVVFKRILQGQRVDHRGQHTHVIAGRAVHAAGAGGQAAEDVAAANHHRCLDTERLNFGDVLGDSGGNRGIDPVVLVAHEGFARQLQEDTFVVGRGRGRGGRHEVIITRSGLGLEN